MQRRALITLVGLFLAATIAGLGAAAALGYTGPARLQLPGHARAYFFGDSWVGGYSAPPKQGFAYVTSAELGWRATLAPDGSGTGYLYAYSADTVARHFPARAAALPARIPADVVVIEGGINDQPAVSLVGLENAAEETIATLRTKTGAPVILVGPAPNEYPYSSKLDDIDRRLRDAAAAAGDVHYVSPIEERWITKANVGWVIDRITGHPGTLGHAYYGHRLAADIRGFLER